MCKEKVATLNMEAEVGVLVTATASQVRLAARPYSVLVVVEEEDDALQFLEVLVAHGVHMMLAVAVRVEVAMAVMRLMSVLTPSVAEMVVAVPLEAAGQYPQERLELEVRQEVVEAEAEVLMPLADKP